MKDAGVLTFGRPATGVTGVVLVMYTSLLTVRLLLMFTGRHWLSSPPGRSNLPEPKPRWAGKA